MTVPATQVKTYTTPPAGATRTAVPGYVQVTIQPPDKVVQGGGRSGDTRTPQPAYTMYVPPPAAPTVSYKTTKGQTYTINTQMYPNPEPVMWDGGPIGFMFDNPETKHRDFAAFPGGASRQWANAAGKMESMYPVDPYARMPMASATPKSIFVTDIKPKSGNVPWEQLPLPYTYGDGNYQIYASNPTQNPNTQIRERSKGNPSVFGTVLEVSEDVVETFPEWGPVIAFPLMAAVGAGAFAGGLGAGSTAGLTGAGAGSSAGIAGGGLSSAGTGALTTGLTGSTVTSGLTGAAIGTGAATATPSALGSLAGAVGGGAGSLGTIVPSTDPSALGYIMPGADAASSGATGGILAETGGGLATGGGSALGSVTDPTSLNYVMPGADAASSGATGGILAEGGGGLTSLGSAGDVIADIDLGLGAAGGGEGGLTAGELATIGGGTGGAGGGLYDVMPGAEAVSSGATGGILAEQPSGLAAIWDSITSGNIGDALGQAGSGILDWAIKNPQAALGIFGNIAQLFADDEGPTFDLTGGLGGGAGGTPGKPLPVAPPLQRNLTPFSGDLKYYGTERSQPLGTWDFFGQPPAAPPQGSAAGGPIRGGALSALLPSRYFDGGPGGGQDDLIDAKVSPGEFVFDASTVSDLGDGNNDEGARRLEQMVNQIRQQKRGGRRQLPPKAAAPLDYLRRAS